MPDAPVFEEFGETGEFPQKSSPGMGSWTSKSLARSRIYIVNILRPTPENRGSRTENGVRLPRA